MKHYYVYILLLSNRQLYAGFSTNLNERITAHTNGKVKSTKHRRPLELIHAESYVLESDARRRERFLKTTEGKRFLRQQIRDVLQSKGVIEWRLPLTYIIHRFQITLCARSSIG